MILEIEALDAAAAASRATRAGLFVEGALAGNWLRRLSKRNQVRPCAVTEILRASPPAARRAPALRRLRGCVTQHADRARPSVAAKQRGLKTTRAHRQGQVRCHRAAI